MDYSCDDKITIRICFNAKKYDKSLELVLPRSVNSLKRLKDHINHNIKYNINFQKFRIFNYKGIEIDDSDIDYLKNNQLLFISLDGASFSLLNYFNEYEIIKSIKSGGYGKVYLAKDVLTNKLVAIKQSDVSELSNDEVYNISREALYLESFKQPNIIKYINSFSLDSNFYMVMEYAGGGELNTHISQKTWLTEREAKILFEQLINAIKYMHGKGVIHRDLKPNNILFLDDTKENIAIIDFGICGFSYGNVHETVKAGTLKFVPPEVSFYYIYIFFKYFYINIFFTN